MEQLEARVSVTARNSGTRTRMMPEDIASISNGVSEWELSIVAYWSIACSAGSLYLFVKKTSVFEKSLSERQLYFRGIFSRMMHMQIEYMYAIACQKPISYRVSDPHGRYAEVNGT